MSRGYGTVLLTVLVAHLVVSDPSAEGENSDDIGGNSDVRDYSSNVQCTYEDIVDRKRHAVKVQLLAKLKMRNLSNKTRHDIPSELIRQISEIYKMYSSDERTLQNEAKDDSFPPRENMVFPESVEELARNTMFYKWSVTTEGAHLEKAELHIPDSLAVSSVRIYILSSDAKLKKLVRLPFTSGDKVVELTEFWRQWSIDSTSNRGILICLGKCYDDERDVNLFGIKPFITVRIPAAGSIRVKRGRNSATQSCDQFPDQCCFKDHYLTFKELGLDDYILEPRSFNAGLCMGVCSTMWLEQFYHSHVMSQVMENPANEPRNCCSPKTVIDLKVISWDAVNKEAKMDVIPKMQVRECCCK